jgi:2,3-diaminopropionate biosynthesis protein SbnA
MIVENVLDLIGKTPILKLKNTTDKDTQAEIYAKLEGLNLTGSMKSRSALGMIEAAEKRGELKPGYTIIESTSGNLGYAIAAVGRQKGYKVIIVLDPKTDTLKRNILRAYGAKLHIVSKPDETGAYQPARIKKVKELIKKTPHSWTPDQYQNPDNPLTHYHTTGPEIYEDIQDIDVLIGSVGTCGHMMGISRFLKEKIPHIKIIGVEPEGSVLSGGMYHPYLTQGPGLSFVSKNLDREILTEIVKVSDEDAFAASRHLAKTEGLLYGASAGSIIHVAKQVAEEIGPNKKIVVVLPDDGFRYGMNFYSDNWLVKHGINPKDLEQKGE